MVGIVINGLDIDRVEELRAHMGPNGFNRLLNQGVTITDIDYGSHLDDAAATAIIFTGASPAVNGLPASTHYDSETRLRQPILSDHSHLGNFTDETYSPAAIRVSTLADEIRLDANGLGAVYSISPDPSQAIIMAGHAGNSACWINDDTGKWATTTYYKDLPTVIQTINHRQPLSFRLDTINWTPLLPPSTFSFLPSYKQAYPFRHHFPRSDKNRYEAYKNSGPVNAEVTSISADYVKSMTLGSREPVDMLNLTYTVQPFMFAREADTRAELLDSYLRVDRQLDRLFRAIDASGPGMDNTLVFVAGTPAINATRPDDPKWQIPTGEFSPTRAISLLKMGLMASYGNGDWVLGYHDRQIYLNRQLIKERGKNLEEIRDEAADFLRRMSGVTHAATISEILKASPEADNPFPLPRNIDVDSSGDIFLAIAPGWVIVNESNTSAPQIVERSGNATSSAFILYPSIEPAKLTTPVDARVIAPTVARILRIRSPNGAQLPPLRF